MSTKDLAHQKWSTFSKHWRGYNETNSHSNTNRVHLNQVFANHSEDDEMYPLTVSEIAEAQLGNTILVKLKLWELDSI